MIFQLRTTLLGLCLAMLCGVVDLRGAKKLPVIDRILQLGHEQRPPIRYLKIVGDRVTETFDPHLATILRIEMRPELLMHVDFPGGGGQIGTKYIKYQSKFVGQNLELSDKPVAWTFVPADPTKLTCQPGAGEKVMPTELLERPVQKSGMSEAVTQKVLRVQGPLAVIEYLQIVDGKVVTTMDKSAASTFGIEATSDGLPERWVGIGCRYIHYQDQYLTCAPSGELALTNVRGAEGTLWSAPVIPDPFLSNLTVKACDKQLKEEKPL